MEPGDRAASSVKRASSVETGPVDGKAVSEAVTQRWRLIAVSAALAALAFVQDPARIVNDTKIDLALEPGGFLTRALSLWDPEGSFGQVQNQAYGYLFPMGPFFWLGDVVGAPAWVVQRAWWALLLIVGFSGVVLLCRALGVGSPTAQLLGGLVYVLSPRILTVIGPSSIEVWPMATAPWVLVALVLGLQRGDPRRWAALAALSVAATGGVNAAATAAVLPLGVLLVLLAAPGPRRRSLMIWWPLLTIVATAWWWIPLLLLGSVSPPFLDFIESATTTTFAAQPVDALRGTTNWLPYLDGTQLAGNALVTQPLLILNTAVVVALGLWGLTRRDVPHRTWLIAGVVTGLVLVTAGHGGASGDGGWGSGQIAAWLDGVLAPLRNNHKFDLVLRVPLVIGLVHLVGSVRPVTIRGLRFTGVAVLAVGALVSATTPAWTADLARTGSFAQVPGYWEEATDWMADNTAGENTLVLPGSAFGDYLWGRPRDELVQALGSVPWSLRNAVPLVPPAAIRTLDAFETAFAQGRGSPALADLLRRSGIRYVLVRADLDAPGTTEPQLVHSTLSSTPGMERVARFGPRVGSPPSQTTDDDEVVFVNGGRQSEHAAIEIFELADTSARTAAAQDLEATPALVGSPAAQLLGLFPDGTDVVLGRHVLEGDRPERIVLTDTDRRQEVAFGRVIQNRSASLTEDQEYAVDRPVHDYLAPGDERWQSVPRLLGAESIEASSSRADVDQPAVDRSLSPWSAFDGDPTTRWQSADLDAWLSIDYGRRVSLEDATVTLPAGEEPRRVKVRLDGSERTLRLLPGRPEPIGPGTTRSLRIELPEPDLDPLSVAEVDVPDAAVSRPLRLPDLPGGWGNPTDIVLTADEGAATCWRIEEVTRCVPGRDGRGEDGSTLDRLVPMRAPAVLAAGLSVLPVESAELTDLLAGAVTPTVSSTGALDPAAGPLAMIDGDETTGWIAALEDTSPNLTFAFEEPETIEAVRLTADDTLAASAPRRAVVEAANGDRQEVRFDVDGLAELEDPLRTTSLEVTVTDVYVRSSLGFDGSGTGLPVGVSEAAFPGSGLDPAAGATDVVETPCGTGPQVRVRDRIFETSVSASRAAVMARADLAGTLCDGGDDVRLEEGDNRVVAEGSAAFRPTELRMSQGPGVELAATTAEVDREGSDELTVSGVGQGSPRVVAIAQTSNVGWQAEDARAVTVNGWMQGWVTENGEVEASFAPALLYRLGLGAGLLGVLGLVLWWWRSPSRPFDASPGAPRRRLRAGVLGIAAIAATGVVGGTIGLVAAVASAAVALLLTRSRRLAVGQALGLLAALLYVGATTAYVLRPWNHPLGWAGSLEWPQWLALASLGVMVGAGLRHGGRTERSPIAGTSTKR